MGVATAKVEGASASVAGGDSTGSGAGGATAAELSSTRSSALAEVGTADEVAAGGVSASAELGGRTTKSESESEPPQPAAASAAAVPAAASTHRRHRRRRSRRMHDNKSMVHLSVEAERCSSRVANPAEPAKRRGKINRAVPPAGARAPRSAANCGRGMKPIQDRASWLAQTLHRLNRQKQGLSRNFLRKPAEGFLRLPPAFGETSSQAGIFAGRDVGRTERRGLWGRGKTVRQDFAGRDVGRTGWRAGRRPGDRKSVV